MSRKTKHEEIIKELASLRETPDRDPAMASRGRAKFLLEAKQISEETVSISWFQRLSSVFQSPHMRMSTLTIAIILGFLLVSFTTSAAAASRALPNQFLYPYKIWLENQRLALTVNPEKQAELHLIYAQERLAEIESIQDDDSGTDFEAILENYRHHLNSAEEILSEHQDYLDQEDFLHELETQSPRPSPEIEDESEEEDEPEETPEPESMNDLDEDDRPDRIEDPEETDSPDEDNSSDDPDKTSDPEDAPDDSDDPDDSDPTEEPDEPDNPDDSGSSDQPADPDETEQPDDDD